MILQIITIVLLTSWVWAIDESVWERFDPGPTYKISLSATSALKIVYRNGVESAGGKLLWQDKTSGEWKEFSPPIENAILVEAAYSYDLYVNFLFQTFTRPRGSNTWTMAPYPEIILDKVARTDPMVDKFYALYHGTRTTTTTSGFLGGLFIPTKTWLPDTNPQWGAGRLTCSGKGNLWIIDETGTVKYLKNYQFHDGNQKAQEIMGGFDGSVFIVTRTLSNNEEKGYVIRKWSTSKSDWDDVLGIGGIDLEMDDSSILYVVTNNHEVYRPVPCEVCKIDCNICTGKSCEVCKSTLCLQDGTCKKCLNGKIPIKETRTCDCPPTEYFSNTQCKKCALTLANCAKCSDATTCIQCEDNYGLTSNNQCAKPQTNCEIEHCAKCSDATYCLECSTPYVISKDNTKCVPKTEDCVATVTYCNACSDPLTCTSCQAPFILVNSKCQLATKDCVLLIEHCEACSDSTTCIQCEIPYIKENNKCKDPANQPPTEVKGDLIVQGRGEKKFDLITPSGQKYEQKTHEIDVENIGDHSFLYDTANWPQNTLNNLSKTWTVFGLANGIDYEVPTWELTSHCGFWKQECGNHCDTSETCMTKNHEDAGFWNALTMDKENWCHRMTRSGSTSHRAYKLHPIRNLALTTWGGWLAEQPHTPGWTIHDHEGLLRYTKNAQILNAKPRPDLRLDQLYATEKHGLLSEKHIQHLLKPPTFHVNYTKSDCWDNSIAYNLTYSRLSSVHAQRKNTRHLSSDEIDTNHPGSLMLYTIFKKAKNFLPDLENKVILTNIGLTIFNHRKRNAKDDLDESFTFFDPCNLQFLRLSVDTADSTYLVHAPLGQAVEDFHCIALSTDGQYPNDLHLFEFRNGTRSFTPSNKFIGALSSDYIESYTLQVTHKTDHDIFPPSPNLVVTFQHSLKPGDTTFQITYYSETVTRCSIYLNSDTGAIESVSFTRPDQTHHSTHYLAELPFTHLGTFDCEGNTGTFNIPLNFTKKTMGHSLLDHFEQDKRSSMLTHTHKKHIDPAKALRSSWRSLMHTLETELKVLKNVIALLIVFIASCVSTFLFYCHSRKGRRIYKILPEDDDEYE